LKVKNNENRGCLTILLSFIKLQVFDDPLKMNNIPISCFKVLVGAIFLMELEKPR
jgi:hypothetical protein